MEVKDVEVCKRYLEELISKEIYRFEAETGCKVTGISLMPFRRMDDKAGEGIIGLDVGIH